MDELNRQRKFDADLLVNAERGTETFLCGAQTLHGARELAVALRAAGYRVTVRVWSTFNGGGYSEALF